MKVDVLEAILASAVLYGVGSYLFWANKTIIRDTADAVFGHFQRQGADDERRRRRIEEWKKKKEEEEDEDEDLPALCSCSECRDFKPPPVQVIDDGGKKCD